MSLPVQPIVERLFLDSDGKSFHFVKTQNVQAVLDAAKDAADTLKPNTGPVGGKYLGTVPVLIAQQWAKECGASVGSREWAKYAKTKLKDGTWARLRVHQK
jgi:hypothetical protein